MRGQCEPKSLVHGYRLRLGLRIELVAKQGDEPLVVLEGSGAV